jgi:hypothetical protein
MSHKGIFWIHVGFQDERGSGFSAVLSADFPPKDGMSVQVDYELLGTRRRIRSWISTSGSFCSGG